MSNSTTAAQSASSYDDIGLDALERRLQDDLQCLCYPSVNWVADVERDTPADSDVLIVGGGMCGLLVWFALRTAGIHNVRIIDQSPAGSEGPWVNYARMETLRSPKQLTGPAYGMASLTFQAWYRARFGAAQWDELDKIPRPQWMEYLRWYRQALQVPVENNVRLAHVESRGELLALTLEGAEASAITVRKLIYATGRDGIAKANIPDFVSDVDKSLWAHSSEDIDFTSLRGKRVAVVGVGASAVDNAAEALEAGASEVRHLIRRTEMPTINKMMGIGSYGFVAGYAELSDEWRWRFMQYSFATQTPSPRGSTLRVSRHENAWFHFGKSVSAVRESSGGLLIDFADGSQLETDFLILGTGFSTDPLARRELGDAAANIRLWEDAYTPPADEENADLGRFPYLAEDFSFREKQAGRTPWLKHVHCFNYGATASLGKVSGDIPGISEGARWLAKSLSARLYEEDIAIHWQHMLDYSKPELQGDEWTPSELPESSMTRKVI
ncbi:NAD(P)-binding domain-containing protein [Granulosicoccus sp. 3-233]|uniref:NAD(P)-binding domain-containing protein n=1 Tax=Granulosicoccus sp. 3-233 TaxID=3417969 RepID=UPI003D3528E2